MTIVKLAEHIEIEKQNVDNLRTKSNERYDSLLARVSALHSQATAQATALGELDKEVRTMKHATDEELDSQHAALDAILGGGS